MKCDPSGQKKDCQYPFAQMAMWKAFHIETSVFLANYCLYPWDSTLRVWSVWTAGFLKWLHDWIQGHWESSWKGWGCPNSHDTKESSLRNTLYPNTPFNSVISTSQQQQQQQIWSRASHYFLGKKCFLPTYKPNCFNSMVVSNV